MSLGVIALILRLMNVLLKCRCRRQSIPESLLGHFLHNNQIHKSMAHWNSFNELDKVLKE